MSGREILHIATDEKFIDAANYLYEKAFPRKNTFIIIKAESNQPLKHVRLKDNCQIYVQSDHIKDAILKKTKKFDVIVFHGLNDDMVEVFNRSEKKRKFIWTFWGAEVYNSKLYEKSIYGPKTRLLLNLASFSWGFTSKERKALNDFELFLIKKASKLSAGAFKIIDKVKKANKKIEYSGDNGKGRTEKKRAINDFQFIAKLDENIDQLKNMGLFRENCTTIPFSYYPLEFLFNKTNHTIEGNNILLGNSSARTNNHVEMIDFLSDLDLRECQIITPLSYGDMEFASVLERYGKEKLGESFYPLTDFLPLEDYHNIIRSCGFVIMNHYRPQGVGNILFSLYMGSKVFLNDTSFYRYLKRIGCHVYSIEEDLVAYRENAFEHLTPAEIEHNRKKLENEISTKTIVKNLRASFRENFNIGF